MFWAFIAVYDKKHVKCLFSSQALLCTTMNSEPNALCLQNISFTLIVCVWVLFANIFAYKKRKKVMPAFLGNLTIKLFVFSGCRGLWGATKRILWYLPEGY